MPKETEKIYNIKLEMATMKEQISNIQCDVTDLKVGVKEISTKLDNFISTKSDKDEVIRLEKELQNKLNKIDFEKIETRIWYLTAGIILALIGALINFIIGK